MNALQRRLSTGFFAILSLPATAMGFALSVQISALSWILSTEHNLDIHQVGLVWAAGPIAGIVGQVIIGFISDKTWFWGGRRRPFIWIGGTLASLSLVALTQLGTLSHSTGFDIMWVAIAVALTLDLSINIGFNPTRSVIADVTPEGEKRTRGYTLMQTISGAFGVLAYGIGAYFGNYELIFFAVGLVLVFSLVPPLFITEPPALAATSIRHTHEVQPTSDYRQLLRIYLAHGFCWLGVQTMFVNMFFYVRDVMGITANDQAGQIVNVSFLILNAIGFLLPALLLEPLAKRIGRVKVHIIAMATMALGYVLVLFGGTSPLWLYVFMAVAGVGWAATVSLPFAIMTEKVDKAKMGLFMGIFNLSVVLPQLIVSVGLSKIIEDSENKSIIFVICAVALAVSTALWSLVKEQAIENRETQKNTTFTGSH
ncbi:MAG: MFS transporter [Cyclobacteriaceae bacterium]|nr:MFS transporter [Cyclobacteriaceae bacterium]